MQSPLRVASLKQASRLIRQNFATAFPKLCSYKQWIARIHRLSDLVGLLIEAARRTDGFRFSLYAIDSKPIPVCKPIRHRAVTLFRDEGAYFGKTSAGWFFGFKLHVLINIEGQIVAAAMTGANVADREASVWLTAADGRILAADQAHGREQACEALEREAAMLVLTRKRVRPKKGLLMSRVRQSIER